MAQIPNNFIDPLNLYVMNWIDETELRETDALIVVDIQYDFLEGGSLAVPSGNDIIEGVNKLGQKFLKSGKRIIFTQDWHPPGHHSFASVHDGKEPFDPIEGIEGIGPVLWPDHCVQGSKGSEFHHDLNTDMAHLIIRKGFNLTIDSYSAIQENDKKTETGLAGYLQTTDIERVFVVGLATDYCVNYTAQDAAKKGFEVVVVDDLARGIAENTIDQACSDMAELGVKFIKSANIA